VDWIFHQAAQAGVRPSWDNKFTLYLHCNVLATQRLLEAAAQTKSVRRFIYASSSSVYGDVDTLPIVETVRPGPYSPYGVTKLAAEHLCSLYYRNLGVPTVSLRYFTVYGPRQRPDMAFHRFCKAIVERRPMKVYGDGWQTRDFTYVSDVVEANIRAATADAAVGEVVNIAGGSRVPLREAIRMLEEISGVAVPVTFEEVQKGDVRDTFADTQLAARYLGYAPLVSLKEGLAREFEDIQALYTDVTLSGSVVS
jgi:nucleoside-diphosphate-sugar epimerase